MNIPFKKGNILIPKKNINMTKWSVVACDQYTSEPEYWQKVEKYIGNEKSTLKLTLPEVYLDKQDTTTRITKINQTMQEYLDSDTFDEYEDTMIYIERTQNDGKIREGLIGLVDLEDYSYEPGSQTPIRATEKTVIERIPPRLKVRENALIELPHIMILIDDDKKEIIEDIKKHVTTKDIIYDFDLMENGGHLKGYKLASTTCDDIITKISKLAYKRTFQAKYGVKDKGVLLFAMGDGNHSLATAKAHYENLKKTMPKKEYLKHPARYALVEIVNLHSNALEFEAIHRIVNEVNVDNLLTKLQEYYTITETPTNQKFTILTKDSEKILYIENPKSNIAVGSIQIFLDEYLKNDPGKIDYIHGEDVVKNLAKEDNAIGFIFEPMAKEELFKTVILDGALPRKTFSMGHSYDKRFYLEARKIK